MKIKHEQESLHKLREFMAMHPGVMPDLDEISDEEVADRLETFVNSMAAIAPKIREAAQEMTREMTRALKAAADFGRAMESRP